ncbi:hypothetical protein DEO72_LG2g1342 [Vigna unguiculata]|uniref:Uncharacterized protein n=1 Tax=Vigna unguiculata TaxID=3917 RepID=A0A4D6KTI6_VIGUN|nr:hypothetical protein DEO72_LG2g1342 [Vigna unguiculata]
MSKTSIILTLVVAVMVSCFVGALRDRKIEGLYLVVALLSFASVVLLAFRVTMVTSITLLVLLSFAGYRRRVLVQQGWLITLDVAWSLGSSVFRSQKGLFALVCATLLSLFATYGRMNEVTTTRQWQ